MHTSLAVFGFPVYYIDVDISVIFALFHAHHALVAQNPGCVTVQ